VDKTRPPASRLKRGRYSRRAPEKVDAAGCQPAAAVYTRIRSKVGVTLKVDHPLDVKRGQGRNLVRTMLWKSGIFRPKPQSPVFSEAYKRPSLSNTKSILDYGPESHGLQGANGLTEDNHLRQCPKRRPSGPKNRAGSVPWEYLTWQC